jgi:hypothetical protein
MIFQLELATLIRVQNLSQTATDFREKLHTWDLRVHRIIINDKNLNMKTLKLKKLM